MEEAVLKLKARLHLGQESVSEKRGDFPAITFGISYGNGQKVGSFRAIISQEVDQLCQTATRRAKNKG